MITIQSELNQKTLRLFLVDGANVRIHLVPGKLFIGRDVCALVRKDAPRSPPSGNQRRYRLGLESRAVSALVWKAAPSPPWSRRLRLGLESRAVSALVWKAAPSPPWSRRLRLGLESRAVSALVWKAAPSPPSPPWSGKSRRLRLGLESRAFSALVAKVTP